MQNIWYIFTFPNIHILLICYLCNFNIVLKNINMWVSRLGISVKSEYEPNNSQSLPSSLYRIISVQSLVEIYRSIAARNTKRTRHYPSTVGAMEEISDVDAHADIEVPCVSFVSQLQ
ncbi:hypothetical protein BABINDRAFT_110091 [Babjeviella inositovora NRRL Y-12698]|uniref:Uncharacterized protein n=1 Tax=Babjeviella inositovora NRRL Y-12698 TaxID=984486 RepID=A0A1E3QX76_9ASCO|nr:uncharacterized protein BABINDRAFT_110091 [Babjeviella inositovora NRRL Y-12698]ODQ81682.1 hypothetical protein BABINDRAFT_110091 [Babjeviella inositovora NRRL Y-12698]